MPSLYDTTATVGEVSSSNFTTLYNSSGLSAPNAGGGAVGGCGRRRCRVLPLNKPGRDGHDQHQPQAPFNDFHACPLLLAHCWPNRATPSPGEYLKKPWGQNHALARSRPSSAATSSKTPWLKSDSG